VVLVLVLCGVVVVVDSTTARKESLEWEWKWFGCGVKVEGTIPTRPAKLKVVSAAAADSFDSCQQFPQPQGNRCPRLLLLRPYNQSAKVEWHLGQKVQNATPAAEVFSRLTWRWLSINPATHICLLTVAVEIIKTYSTNI